MSSRIITLPNVLTVFRMALIPVFVSLLFYQKFLLALGVFVIAGITDGLDGVSGPPLSSTIAAWAPFWIQLPTS